MTSDELKRALELAHEYSIPDTEIESQETSEMLRALVAEVERREKIQSDLESLNGITSGTFEKLYALRDEVERLQDCLDAGKTAMRYEADGAEALMKYEDYQIVRQRQQREREAFRRLLAAAKDLSRDQTTWDELNDAIAKCEEVLG